MFDIISADASSKQRGILDGDERFENGNKGSEQQQDERQTQQKQQRSDGRPRNSDTVGVPVTPVESHFTPVRASTYSDTTLLLLDSNFFNWELCDCVFAGWS